MLLRNRWTLIEADYTTGITALTHYSLSDPTEDPRSLVRDAIFLDRNRDSEAGALLIQRYSGRPPKRTEALPSRSTSATRVARTPLHRPSPSASPGRFASQQRQLEGLFREVTGNLQKRTEGWDVSKAVRSAVGEVRRNVNNYQSAHSRQSSADGAQRFVPEHKRPELKAQDEATRDLQHRFRALEERNIVLAKMLDDALQSLRAIKLTNPAGAGDAEDNLNISLAKIQFISVYLSDSDIPIPNEETVKAPKPSREMPDSSEKQPAAPVQTEPSTKKEKGFETGIQALEAEKRGRDAHIPPQRPSLMDSSFSFMLGENRHRSSFVSSVADLPEHSRESESRSRPKKKALEAKPHPERKGSDSENDGFSLNKIQGG
jgi:TBC1 domain family protein 5